MPAVSDLVSVRRLDSEWGSREIAARETHPLLAWLVLRYAGYIERTKLPVRRLEAPFAGVVMILSFGKRLSIRDTCGTDSQQFSFVGGLSDKPTYTEHDGDQHGIQIDLTPLAAHALLGLPMAELTNRVGGLDDLLGPAASELLEQLWGHRLLGATVRAARRRARTADHGGASRSSGGRLRLGAPAGDRRPRRGRRDL